MARIPYGNDPAKIERYRAFWSRGDARRPLVAFTLVGWFPLRELACWRASDTALTPEMIDPAGLPRRPHPHASGRRNHGR